MRGKVRSSAVIVFVLALVTFGGWLGNVLSAHTSARSPDYYYAIQKNIELFGKVYQEISKRYVEEIDPEKFMQAGIRGMLSTLDPYTVLIEKDDGEELQIMTQGKYGGVGMRIAPRNGMPTVVEPPFEGTPALKAGIREGDVILEVDGVSTKTITINEVASKLRGEVGTEVTVKIAREGEAKPLEFRLVRAEIVVKDVVYSGFIEEGIGYIKLMHFSRNAGQEVEEAIRALKKQGLKALVLDLRNDPGGLLESAVAVAENFIPKGKLIVSTKGRSEGSAQEYRSARDPVLGDLPLVVLVNEYSASASEIVAGAIQDLDRGVILGTDTWGKGLVQTVIPITRDAALKVTTAKYYLPSGRLIQKPEMLRHEFSVFTQDTLSGPDGPEKPDYHDGKADQRDTVKVEYKTATGRMVYGDGGIRPDITIPPQKLNRFEQELLRKSMLFNFAVAYASKNRNVPRDFQVDEPLLQQFKSFLAEKKFTYRTDGEDELEKLEKVARENHYAPETLAVLAQMKQALEREKGKDFQRSLEFIQRELRREIAAKFWGTRAEVEATFTFDPVIQKAVEVVKHPENYSSILKGQAKVTRAK